MFSTYGTHGNQPGLQALMSRSRSSSSSSDGGPPEITLDALSADTLAALNLHLAGKDAAEVRGGLSSWCGLAMLRY